MQPPSDIFNIGSRVRIEGLQAQPELNGRTGVTLAFNEESGRWSVQIYAGDKGPAVQKLIRPANMKVINPALHAESERNRLYKRCATSECGAPATSFCDRCNVAPYCSSKCQQAHWPRHRAACVAYVKQPENRDAVAITLKLVKKLTEERAFPHDWEHPYSYIFIRPVPDSTTWCALSTIAAVEGIAEANLPLPNHAGEVTTDAMNVRFQWTFSGTMNIVRGYSYEDTFALRAWMSDSFDPKLPPNQMGQQLAFVQGCRGGVVVQKFDSETRALLPITRREVWEIATVRGEGGALGLLSDRMMRENARRREQMAAVTEFAPNVQVLDCSPGSGATGRQ